MVCVKWYMNDRKTLFHLCINQSLNAWLIIVVQTKQQLLQLLLQPFNGLFSRTTWVSRYQKGKTNLSIWILLEQETVSGCGISWTICKSAPHSRQITTPVPHHSVFLQAGCPSCHPTNSVKAQTRIYILISTNMHICRLINIHNVHARPQQSATTDVT